MKKTILLFVIIILTCSCESHRVKENRDIYIEFLKSMSDAPEYLKIHSEIVNDDNEANIYFIVDFEIVYIGRRFRDEVRIDFIGNYMSKIDGVSKTEYKGSYLINIIQK